MRKPSEKRSKQKLNQEFEEVISQQHKPTNPKGNILNEIRLDLKCKNENQKKLVKSIELNDVTVCSGPAGCGKTIVACYEGLYLLKTQPEKYKKIVIVKSVTTLKDEELGFLKGSLMEKMEPFVYSFIHNFEKLIGKYNVERLKENSIIEVIPIAYMRGINIDESFIVVDEVQNISIENIKTILTRIGSNSKMVLLGDLNQTDIKNKKNSSLNYLIEKIKKNNIEGVGVVELNENDIVRHKLTSYFINLFKEPIIINKEPQDNIISPTPSVKEKILKFFKNLLF